MARHTDKNATRCTLCGAPRHTTEEETLACSQTRRKEFAELSRLAASLGKPKKATS